MFIVFKKEKSFLIILFLLSFLIRALVFHFYLSKDNNYWQVDSDTYHKVAVGICSGCGIAHEKDTPCFYRVPGYPIFLSLYYKFFDTDQKNVLWLQIILASLIPVLVFLLSLSLFPDCLLLAKISSLYSVFHLGFVLYSGFFMSESLFIFLFLLFAILFFKFRNLFWAGVFLGLASLVRPVGQYFVILSIVMIFLFNKFGIAKLKKAFYLFLGWLIPVSLWLLRNYILLGHIFFHTLPGGHFLYLSAARVAMHVQDCSYWQARENLKKESDLLIQEKTKALGRPLNEIEHCQVLESLALKYFKSYPILSLKNWITDMFRSTFSLYSAELVYLYNNRKEIDYFDKNRSYWNMFERYLFPQVSSNFLKLIIFLEILFFLFILLGFALGLLKVLVGVRTIFKKPLIQSARRSFFRKSEVGCIEGEAWLKVLPFMALFIVLALSGGYARMRLPAEPFLIILSFSFWLNLFCKKGRKGSLCQNGT